MTDTNVLVVTIGDGNDTYEEGREAIRKLADGRGVDAPATVTFRDEEQLSDVFDGRTYALLRTIREERPESIRETARLVGRDVKNVHGELTTLEALGVIRFEEHGRSKRPVFPYDDLLIRPFEPEESDAETVPS